MKCNYCYDRVQNRVGDRIVLCMNCWNRLQALADIGEDVLKHFPDWDKMKAYIEKDLQFQSKWINTLKYVGVIKE